MVGQAPNLEKLSVAQISKWARGAREFEIAVAVTPWDPFNRRRTWPGREGTNSIGTGAYEAW